MSDGLKALMQRHAEELEGEQAAHRDALALCEVYEQRIAELEARARALDVLVDWATWQRCLELEARIAELESAYKGLVELNERNCNDALRIKGASDATLALMFLVFDDIKAKDARIAELQRQLGAAREEMERISQFKIKEKNHGNG